MDAIFTKLSDPDRRGRDAFPWGYHAPHEKAIALKFTYIRRREILYDFFPRIAGFSLASSVIRSCFVDTLQVSKPPRVSQGDTAPNSAAGASAAVRDCS